MRSIRNTALGRDGSGKPFPPTPPVKYLFALARTTTKNINKRPRWSDEKYFFVLTPSRMYTPLRRDATLEYLS